MKILSDPPEFNIGITYPDFFQARKRTHTETDDGRGQDPDLQVAIPITPTAVAIEQMMVVIDIMIGGIQIDSLIEDGTERVVEVEAEKGLVLDTEMLRNPDVAMTIVTNEVGICLTVRTSH